MSKKYRVFGEWYQSNVILECQGVLLQKSFDTEEEANSWLNEFAKTDYYRFIDEIYANFETKLADVVDKLEW